MILIYRSRDGFTEALNSIKKVFVEEGYWSKTYGSRSVSCLFSGLEADDASLRLLADQCLQAVFRVGTLFCPPLCLFRSLYSNHNVRESWPSWSTKYPEMGIRPGLRQQWACCWTHSDTEGNRKCKCMQCISCIRSEKLLDAQNKLFSCLSRTSLEISSVFSDMIISMLTSPMQIDWCFNVWRTWS